MTAIARRGLCLVLSAPSGAGKTAITRALIAREPELRLSVSVTTRPPRPGESDGVHYHFVDQARFDQLVQSGGLLEWAQVLGRHCYGTPRAPVEQALAAGRDMIFDIDWQGHAQLRTVLPDDVESVFILPPDLVTLESRLRARAGDDVTEIARRMSLAREEISHWREFGHIVINDEFARAVDEVGAILHAARLKTARRVGMEGFVRAMARP